MGIDQGVALKDNRQGKKMILVFSTAFLPLIGGAELAILEIAKRLSDFKFIVICARLKRYLEKEEEIENIKVYRVGFGFWFDKYLLPFLGFIKAKTLKPHFIHAYLASYGALAALFYKIKYKNTPFILTLQEGSSLARLKMKSLFLAPLYKLIFKKADVITTISRYLASYAQSIHSKIKPILIPNGVDFQYFSQEFSYGEIDELKTKLGIKPYDKVIVTVSRLVFKNAVDDLIKALAILKNKIEDLKLIVIGEGKEKKYLYPLVDVLGLENKVLFLGTISPRELPKYLKITDIFVRPSRSEGMGSAFLEAMAAGVPVIATPVGGIVDFLTDKKTGLVCQVNNSEDLASKIETCLTDQALKEKIVKNASVLVKEKYDWSIIAEKMRLIYESF